MLFKTTYFRILYHFHKNSATQHVHAKVSPPRLNGTKTGVFATRSPHRPSPIGLSLVKIDRITENTVYFTGVDMVDQTPVIDIKPYIPQYDSPDHLNVPRLQDNTVRLGAFDVDVVALSDDHEESANFRVMDGEENSGQNVSNRTENPPPIESAR